MRIEEDLLLPVVCNLDALTDPATHGSALTTWRAAVIATHELPNGYEFELPGTNEMLATVATFISNERECCPFFTFGIQLAPKGTLRFRLTGPEGTRELLQQGFGQRASR